MIGGQLSANTSGYILWGDQQEGDQPQLISTWSEYNDFTLTHTYSDNSRQYDVSITGSFISLDLTYGQRYSNYFNKVYSLANTLTNAHQLFYQCQNLYQIDTNTFILPSGLTDATSMFGDCYNLNADISNIFNLWGNPDNQLTRIIPTMFNNCQYIVGVIPPQKLWNSADEFEAMHAFANCILLTNYNDIPEQWKNTYN